MAIAAFASSLLERWETFRLLPARGARVATPSSVTATVAEAVRNPTDEAMIPTFIGLEAFGNPLEGEMTLNVADVWPAAIVTLVMTEPVSGSRKPTALASRLFR